MAEAAATEVTTEPVTPAEAAPAAAEPAPDILDQAFANLAAQAEAEEGEATDETPAEATPKPEAKPDDKAEPEEPTAENLEAADEALFTDAALKTAAGVKNAATRLRVIRAELKASTTKLEKRQHAVDHDFRVLKNREKRFDKTKSEHLAWHERERGTARLLGEHVNVLRTGSPAQVVESLGFLTGKDGMAIYEEIVRNAAGMRQAPNPEIEAVRRELREEREERQREREESRRSAETQHKQAVVERRKAEILETSKDTTRFPNLAELGAIRPRELLNEVVAIKRTHLAETGEALPDGEALLELERQVALLRKQQGGGAGNPRPEESRNPGGKPSLSSPAKRTGSVAGIPPSASARVAPIRPATEEELRQELTPEYYDAIGLG
jgi:hypothetical protein